ncbi:hypothetical protein HPO_03214 [Hyphomonas polymorpha PS728]|uniref:Uncharacterized protein n=1 Tax=Hyphomonas polymorpha PS728 TaxID=1280954 RepID=A0A062VMD9_9PROT|nr:hypothetical protein [Hyphomonas polymorpha]KCZ99868.1 hypothetical protein HPO_03214 [Hyphomonas polymorpha PS728]
MNAVKKPHDREPETPAAKPADEMAEAPARTGHHSPVHVLHSRLEAAFTPQNESRLMRILTMLLVVALSTWLAAQVLLGGA